MLWILTCDTDSAGTTRTEAQQDIRLHHVEQEQFRPLGAHLAHVEPFAAGPFCKSENTMTDNLYGISAYMGQPCFSSWV